MAEGTFREEPTGWNRSSPADLYHDSRSRRRRVERHWLSANYSFERFDDRVLWGNFFRNSHHGAVFWSANRERICWRGSACSLLSAHADRNLPARATVS